MTDGTLPLVDAGFYYDAESGNRRIQELEERNGCLERVIKALSARCGLRARGQCDLNCLGRMVCNCTGLELIHG